MSAPQYEQLDGQALQMLQAEVRKTSIKVAAEKLGYSRPSVSMALAGKYIGSVRKIRARIFEIFAERVDCPFVGDIAPAECKDYRERPIPSAPRSAIAHWRACRHCAFNPDNLIKKTPEAADA
ncbi:MAG: hypothetical protein KGL46_03835 [Hyphomicrobiales bacterium]|nr:hypothetical protein [Hyphomicrobiales bacterium]